MLFTYVQLKKRLGSLFCSYVSIKQLINSILIILCFECAGRAQWCVVGERSPSSLLSCSEAATVKTGKTDSLYPLYLLPSRQSQRATAIISPASISAVSSQPTSIGMIVMILTKIFSQVGFILILYVSQSSAFITQ